MYFLKKSIKIYLSIDINYNADIIKTSDELDTNDVYCM